MLVLVTIGRLVTRPPYRRRDAEFLAIPYKVHRLHLVLCVEFVAIFAGGELVGLVLDVVGLDHEVLHLGEDVGGLLYLPFGEEAGLLLEIFLHLVYVGKFKR